MTFAVKDSEVAKLILVNDISLSIFKKGEIVCLKNTISFLEIKQIKNQNV